MLIYCYGVIKEDRNFSIKGFESKKTYLIRFKDISGVVSDVSEKIFSQEEIDKNVKDMKWLAEHVQVHEDVIDAVMKETTIIPMKFCTIFKNKAKAEAMLEEKYADLKYNLEHLKDKVEMGIKVYFDTTCLRKKILEESPEIKKLEEEAGKKTPGRAYFEKQKIETLLKEEIRKKLASDAKIIFDKVKALAEEAKQNELLNKKVTGKDMILNAVFLLKKQSLEKFKDEIEKVKSEHKDLIFEVWGPFPPYNFIQ